MFDFTATPSRPAKSPGDVAATSPRPTETRVANRSPTSLHASEIGAFDTDDVDKSIIPGKIREGRNMRDTIYDQGPTRENKAGKTMRNLLTSRFRIVAGQNNLDWVTNAHFTDLIKPYRIG